MEFHRSALGQLTLAFRQRAPPAPRKATSMKPPLLIVNATAGSATVIVTLPVHAGGKVAVVMQATPTWPQRTVSRCGEGADLFTGDVVRPRRRANRQFGGLDPEMVSKEMIRSSNRDVALLEVSPASGSDRRGLAAVLQTIDWKASVKVEPADRDSGWNGGFVVSLTLWIDDRGRGGVPPILTVPVVGDALPAGGGNGERDRSIIVGDGHLPLAQFGTVALTAAARSVDHGVVDNGRSEADAGRPAGNVTEAGTVTWSCRRTTVIVMSRVGGADAVIVPVSASPSAAVAARIWSGRPFRCR